MGRGAERLKLSGRMRRVFQDELALEFEFGDRRLSLPGSVASFCPLQRLVSCRELLHKFVLPRAREVDLGTTGKLQNVLLEYEAALHQD